MLAEKQYIYIYSNTRSVSEWKDFLKVTFEEDDGAERHDNHADEQVGNGEGHQEVVGHVLQLPVLHHDAKELVVYNTEKI